MMMPVNIYKDKKSPPPSLLSWLCCRWILPSPLQLQQHGHNNKKSSKPRSGGRSTVFLALLLAVGCCSIGFAMWLHARLAGILFSVVGFSSSRVSSHDWTTFQQDYHGRFHRPAPESLYSWLSYARANQCNERHFYHDMDDDLAFYRTQLHNQTKKQQQQLLYRQDQVVPHGLEQTDNYIAFALQNHQLTTVASRNFGHNDKEQAIIEQKLRWLLEPVVYHVPPLNATYFFNLHDGPTRIKSPQTAKTVSVPIFSVCKVSYWTDDQVAPKSQIGLMKLLWETKSLDFETIGNHHRAGWRKGHKQHNPYHPLVTDTASFDSHDVLVPYHFGMEEQIPPINPNAKKFVHRNNSILWRGSTTGHEFGKSPRFHLVSQFGGTGPHPISENVPDVAADIAFQAVLQNSTHDTLAPNSRIAPQRLSYEDYQEHKYILDVDGNAFTSRFPGLLRSGSLIFKSTRYREWYTERLRPFVDFIPVNYNLSDLVEKVKWAHDHPEVAEKMALHAERMANTHMRLQDMRCYLYRLLLEYQTLFE